MQQYTETETLQGGKILAIYLNHPESFNSLNPAMLTEIKSALEAAENDENIRCVALSGRGKAFCAGQNLKAVLSQEKRENLIKEIVEDFYNPLVKKITDLQKPVIALVNGPAVGAGAMLALISDIALATESAYFSLAFSQIGLLPDTGGTYFLPKLLGRQTANYLSFTGKKISASEAKNLGLIADVFKDEDFKAKSQEVLSQIANSATKAIGLTKMAFNESYSKNLDEMLKMEAELQQKLAETDDFKEGVTAFVEKRTPKYIGK